VIDTHTNTVVASVPRVDQPTGVAVKPVETRVYVTDGCNGIADRQTCAMG
jgi:DNA-binding beta-propeller fold protein YncE